MSALRGVTCLLLVAAVAATAGGCGDDDGDGAKADDGSGSANPLANYKNPPMHARVEITSKGYRPKHVRILVGGTVTFVNLDINGNHTAETEDIPDGPTDNNEFDTHTLTWEEPYAVTFHKPERVTYSSSLDPWMKGSVTAVPKADLSQIDPER